MTTDSTTLKTSRYVHGGTTERTLKFIEWWEKRKFPNSFSDIVYTVEKFYEGRLDLVANAFYSEPRYWWIIAQYNEILDPTEEVIEGKQLLIPTLDRIRTEFLIGKLGGTISERILKPKISPIII